MPIPQTVRIAPIDLQQNVAIGLSLPFGSKDTRLFNSTYSTKDQIKSNLINLLLTNKGERVMNPDFGCDIKNLLFEGIDDDLVTNVTDVIKENVSTFIPDITIEEVIVDTFKDENRVNILIKYFINISSAEDSVSLQFI